MSLSTVIEPHPTIADVDLQPIAVVLQLVHPARTSWGLLGDDWLARMNENGARVDWPGARARLSLFGRIF